jgi:acyl transferase domain-containing protein
MNDFAPEPIAIVGVGAIMPSAPDAEAFWANITNGRYCITDVPPERWDPSLYYDPDPRAPYKTYSRIGGWVHEFGWDPIGWRLPVPPTVAVQLDDGQKWAITAARAALLDAGWPQWTVDPERVAVVIGNAIGGEKHYDTNLHIEFPSFARAVGSAPSFAALPEGVRTAVLTEAREAFNADFPGVTEDTMPGELANIIAGRVANLFNFRGPNFTTDAACASGLAAMSAAARGLQAHDYDAVITGGVDRNMGVSAFVKFCKIGALSATGTRPFDAGADGFVMGEGAALFVLKRLADAERAGDRVYAVLLGVGGSSDGRGKGITAPNPVGQRLAVERAWENAGTDPAKASYVEAHGTSTRVGDATELSSLTEVFGKAGAPPGSIALGSVKSNIGHLKAAAGTAGLFKAMMSLHHRVLPPSLNFVNPNPNVDWAEIPFRVNTELREWPAPPPGDVRSAGVSAFGFGGTNFHVVLEEYVPGRHRPERAPRSYAGVGLPRPSTKAPMRGAAVVGGPDEADVAAQLDRLRAEAEAGRAPVPVAPDPGLANAAVRVAIDYGDAAELAAKAGKAVAALRSGNPATWRMLRVQGVHLGRGPAPKVAFLYTGQGSQYVNMLRPLRDREPIVADAFAEADRIMTPLLGRPLTSYIFVDPSDTDAVRAAEQQLLQTEITQPAVLTADLALTNLLAAYGVRPDLVMGHSLGEYGALVAAGALSFDAALEAVSARGREMAHLDIADRGAMAAVFGPLEEIERTVGTIDGYVVVANVNSTSQAVVGGATAAVERTIEALRAAGLTARRIPVSHAFHTSIVAPVSEPLTNALRRLELRSPQRPIVSNVTGEFYPTGAGVDAVLDLLGRQVASPVQFVAGLRTLYAAGARVFVEVGPKKALHGFVEDVLGGDHDDVLALFTNHPKLGDEVAFNQALCGLYAAGLGYPAAPEAERPIAVDTPERTVPMTNDRYAELGRLFAGVLEEGLRVYQGTPEPARAQPAPSGLRSEATREDGAWKAPEPARAQASARNTATAPVVITGAALGLPGVERVFDDDNVARILDGQQFIDTIPHKLRRAMLDRRITRLVKRAAGDPTFETIDREADVIKLAGRHAPFDVVAEFGIDAARDAALDTATRLAIGAGFDALRDAGIPLVMHYKTTTLGTSLPDRWGLPDKLRDDTGIIFASAFPGYNSFAEDLEGYFTDRGRREQLLALEGVRSRMRGDEAAVPEVDRRIAEVRRLLAAEPYAFNRRFLFRCLSMGHSQFAEVIGARGPNTQLNAACASTTQAICVAEDWIRAGRCRRVVVISADDATTDAMLPWLGAGFLASGAAATDDAVEDAATPFDRRRHGMIVGMGAAALVVESAEAARERGIQPICEVLGAVTANSAYHGTRLDVEHIGQVMEGLVRQAETHDLDRRAIAAETMFVSHETYTPARGGSAAAEINALRHVFGTAADSVIITNTKGFTGHAMAAGIEDVVAVKALETGIVPPVPNYKEPDPELGQLNLSTGGTYPVRYALRLAAGFGSQIAMALLRWTPVPSGHRAPDQLGYAYRIVDQATWQHWLDTVSGRPGAALEVVQRRLRVVDTSVPQAVPTPSIVETVEPVATVAPVDPVSEQVVEIVSGLTGYPPELLDIDLDLEADLGVDTVKQAEVFAAVRERFTIARDDNLQLRDFPTLSHVIGWIREKTGTPSTLESTEPAVTVVTPPNTGTLPRRVPVPVLRPDLSLCAPTGVEVGPGSRVVVMLDEGGVGEALATQLRKTGADALTLPAGTATPELLTRIDEWRGGEPVLGVYWLPALDDEGPLEALDLAGWREALRRRVGALYATMRHLYSDQPFLVTGTRLGGYHGYDEAGATCPLGGAVTGFAKAYRKEQPVLVKAVDFTPSRKTAALAHLLVEETLRDPGCVEVGYADDLRWGVGLAERPFGDGTGGLALGPDTVFLVTGAAGSIVSAITADLASASGGTFHLLDLTPTPDAADPDLRRYSTDRDSFKLELAARMRERGERPTPVLIERELARFERLQAALSAIQAVERAGGTAHYHCVDLTDGDAVGKVMAEVHGTNGRVDVLLHAAGLEISHALPDKEPREFDLVFGVKSDGWFNVLHGAGDMPIGATVVFSSVAGRFGNTGQADYSSANDLLCKSTSGFRRTRPATRAIALDWTAWGGIGMATRGSIPTVMATAGVELLPPDAGVAWIRRELTAGTARGEVVVAGALGQLAADYHPRGGLDETALTGGLGPMIGEVTAGIHNGLTVRTTLDPVAQPFLNHHRIDGTPVLPGVMGLEGFVEAARLLVPGWYVAGLEEVDFRAPVKFYRDEPRTVTITALVHPDGADLLADCRLEAERALPGADSPQRTVHFTGTVRLTRQAPETETETEPVPPGDRPAVSAADVYRLYFHGPAYQVVASAYGYGDGAVARFAANLTANHEPADQPTFAEPRLVELCFQTAGLIEAGAHGRLALPLHVGRVRLLNAGVGESDELTAIARPDGDGFACSVVDTGGRVLLRLEDYRTVPLPDAIAADVQAPISSALCG